MAIKQITVFLENKAGSLLKVTKLLSENGINLRAINIAETADYGLLRLIADDASATKKVLSDEGLIFTEISVVAVAVSDKPGGLNDMLEIFAKENIDVNYMYSIFGNTNDLAYMIMQLTDVVTAEKVLENNNIKTLTPNELGLN